MKEFEMYVGQEAVMKFHCKKKDVDLTIKAGDAPLKWSAGKGMTLSDTEMVPSADGLSCKLTPSQTGHFVLTVQGEILVNDQPMAASSATKIKVLPAVVPELELDMTDIKDAPVKAVPKAELKPDAHKKPAVPPHTNPGITPTKPKE